MLLFIYYIEHFLEKLFRQTMISFRVGHYFWLLPERRQGSAGLFEGHNRGKLPETLWPDISQKCQFYAYNRRFKECNLYSNPFESFAWNRSITGGPVNPHVGICKQQENNTCDVRTKFYFVVLSFLCIFYESHKSIFFIVNFNILSLYQIYKNPKG